MREINNTILYLIENPKVTKNFTTTLEDDGKFRQTGFIGVIDEKVLLSLIRNSKRDKRLDAFLSALTFSLKAEEVTNEVFKELLYHKGPYHDTILCWLAHLPLSYYQLLVLNKKGYEEALCQLLMRIVDNDAFSVYDVYDILLPWKNKMDNLVFESIHYCIGSATNEKRKIAINISSQYHDLYERRK